MNKKSSLTYSCQQCGAFSTHTEGPHWLDSGTTLFCSVCKKPTIVLLLKPDEYQEVVNQMAVDKQ